MKFFDFLLGVDLLDFFQVGFQPAGRWTEKQTGAASHPTELRDTSMITAERRSRRWTRTQGIFHMWLVGCVVWKWVDKMVGWLWRSWKFRSETLRCANWRCWFVLWDYENQNHWQWVAMVPHRIIMANPQGFWRRERFWWQGAVQTPLWFQHQE